MIEHTHWHTHALTHMCTLMHGATNMRVHSHECMRMHVQACAHDHTNEEVEDVTEYMFWFMMNFLIFLNCLSYCVSVDTHAQTMWAARWVEFCFGAWGCRLQLHDAALQSKHWHCSSSPPDGLSATSEPWRCSREPGAVDYLIACQITKRLLLTGFGYWTGLFGREGRSFMTDKLGATRPPATPTGPAHE